MNVYCLPFKKKDLISASSDPRAHFAHFKHAIDFSLPEGSELLAVADGEVVDLKIDSRKGGYDPKYNGDKYLNYLTLKHANGEYSQYCHLKYNGSLVKIGDKVKKGQVIALSGNTGFSTEPHLHFHIFILTDKKIDWETIPINFEEEIKVDRSEEEVEKKFKITLEELGRVRKDLEKVNMG